MSRSIFIAKGLVGIRHLVVKFYPDPKKTRNEKFVDEHFGCDIRQTLACSSFKLGGSKIKREAD